MARYKKCPFCGGKLLYDTTLANNDDLYDCADCNEKVVQHPDGVYSTFDFAYASFPEECVYCTMFGNCDDDWVPGDCPGN